MQHAYSAAVVTAARADLSPAHDRANIAMKYEDLKQTQPLRTTSKNKRELTVRVYYVAPATPAVCWSVGLFICFVCTHNQALFTDYTCSCACLLSSALSPCHYYSTEGKHTKKKEVRQCGKTSAIISLPLTFLLTGGIRTVSRVGLTELAVAYKEKDGLFYG